MSDDMFESSMAEQGKIETTIAATPADTLVGVARKLRWLDNQRNALTDSEDHAPGKVYRSVLDDVRRLTTS